MTSKEESEKKSKINPSKRGFFYKEKSARGRPCVRSLMSPIVDASAFRRHLLLDPAGRSTCSASRRAMVTLPSLGLDGPEFAVAVVCVAHRLFGACFGQFTTERFDCERESRRALLEETLGRELPLRKPRDEGTIVPIGGGLGERLERCEVGLHCRLQFALQLADARLELRIPDYFLGHINHHHHGDADGCVDQVELLGTALVADEGFESFDALKHLEEGFELLGTLALVEQRFKWGHAGSCGCTFHSRTTCASPG